MTVAGTISAEFPVPTANADLTFITGGPDGNIWFSEGNANKIGRLTPQGDLTEFAVPTDGSDNFYLTGGPDGNIWFTETNANKIGRLTLGSNAH